MINWQHSFFDERSLTPDRRGMEDFERSTQARNWTFDEESLEACRRQAVERPASATGGMKSLQLGLSRPRKFASGFHRRYKESLESEPLVDTPMYTLSPTEQELLVRFHAHQIQSLVGPEALLPGLQTNESVTLTAIALFRRFYLSNSVAEIHPRHIAVASAFLASKVEEDRVEVSHLLQVTIKHMSILSRSRI
jgi:cyclin H